MPLDTGQVIGERYRVVKLLGQGGMGAVYRAWDTRLDRPVAVKEMVPQFNLSPDMLAQLRQQFKQEAQILATLVHPNLVRVTDYFSWDDKEYLVMDFVEGESLADRIHREGSQDESQVLAWADQLLQALAYCHQQGVLHRDIKPQNIIITPEGKVMLVDFGLVKLWDPTAPETRTVMRGAGTPEYAPPEQYDMGIGHTDPRSDIYSLGATIYHALTGQVPPTATQRMASPNSFSSPQKINIFVTDRTEEVVLKSLEMAMEDRYQSADDMAQALREMPQPARFAPRAATPEGMGDRGTIELERSTAETPKKEKKKKKGGGILLGLGGVGLAIVAGVCLLLVATPVVLYLIFGDEAAPATPTPGPVAPPTVGPTESAVDTPTPPRPTSTPVEMGAETGAYFEDFSDPTSGWEIGDYEEGSVGYEDGIYFVRSESSGLVMWGVADRSYADVIIEVDATQVEAGPTNDNAYGVKCREQAGDGYGLMISGDGYYSIQVVVDGDWSSLVPWEASDAIRQGNATNHIVAACRGTTLSLTVNGELLAEIEDDTYTEGEIALTATTFESEPMEVHFDDLTARPVGLTLFQDDFSDPSSGWEDGEFTFGSVGYGDGVYVVTSSEQDQMMWGLASRDFSDTIIDVQATQVQAGPESNNAYGVMCRVQPDDDGYLLRVSGDGYYAIQRIVDGTFESLVDWTASPVVNQGNVSNHIVAVCDGTRLALTVNGELLAETEDDIFSEGDIALTATTFEPERTEVHFDDLIVLAP